MCKLIILKNILAIFYSTILTTPFPLTDFASIFFEMTTLQTSIKIKLNPIIYIYLYRF